MQLDEDSKVTVGALLTGFLSELKKANRLKALEIYLSTNRKMDAETRKAVEKKIEEIMK